MSDMHNIFARVSLNQARCPLLKDGNGSRAKRRLSPPLATVFCLATPATLSTLVSAQVGFGTVVGTVTDASEAAERWHFVRNADYTAMYPANAYLLLYSVAADLRS